MSTSILTMRGSVVAWTACMFKLPVANRVMKKLEFHIIELAERCYSVVAQANKTR